MLDYFAIFSRGGALLWALQFTTLKHSPVEALNALVRGCLMEERSNENTFTFTPKSGGHQTLKWTFHNGLGLVFVAVYQKTLSLLYVDELLHSVKQEFVGTYKPNVFGYKEFDATFNRLLREAEANAEVAKRPTQTRSGPPLAPVKNGQITSQVKISASQQKPSSKVKDDEDAAAKMPTTDASSDTSVGVDDGNGSAAEDASKAFDVSKLPKGAAGRGGKGGRPGRPSPAAAAPASKDKKKDEGPKKKVMRNWNTKKADPTNTRLDYTEDDGVSGGDSTAASGYDTEPELRVGVSRMDVEEDEYEEDLDEDLDVDLKAVGSGSAAANGSSEPKKRGLLSSFMSSLAMSVVGKQSLSAADIQPALGDMKKKLMERNVAEEIAQQICDSVGRTLEGQKLSSFTGVGAFVRTAFEDALSGVLNKRSVDVLMDIKKAQARGKPYVIVFCGVNGVGKSTNLAKIAYWLGNHNIKVMIAACDTFRAGAVEQLKTHCARLRVPLYERGYEKDPAKVAFEATKQAERDGVHVVLVDTAGRMQDNEPLMRALSNLINVNEPNLLLFVGEALVGNDAVDQLVKFNRALYDLAPPGTRSQHAIDGIVLTKFDTIDEKVGAALSMVYSSSAPIMFVGCGQTYVDLKKLNVKSVVKSLLK